MRVIAYFMHEHEQAAAGALMRDVAATESYLVGEIDEADVDELRSAGLIIESLEEDTVEETPGGDWDVLPGVKRRGVQSVARGAREFPVDQSEPCYYLIQLRGPLLDKWREGLATIGVELLERIPRDNYVARLAPDEVSAVRDLDYVGGVRPYEGRDTGQPAIEGRAGAAKPEGARMVTYDARLQREEDMDAVMAWLSERHVNVAGSSTRKVRVYLLEDDPLANEFASLPEVASIEEFVPPKLHNEVARVLLGIDAAGPPDRTTNISQTGEGQIVAVADTGLDEGHPDFGGRIVGVKAMGRPGDASDPHGHGTHVAGSVLGGGAASRGKVCGAAPKAKLFFQSVMDEDGGLGGLPLDLSDLFEQAYQEGARIHNNSWGADTNSLYTANASEVDDFVARRRDMLIVISAGNEGQAAERMHSDRGFVDWLSIGSPASAKNALTVGASRTSRMRGGLSKLTYGEAFSGFPNPPISDQNVSGDPEGMAAFSSRGPCDDRRIKPDLVGPGTDIASCKSSLAPRRNFWGTYPRNQRYAFMGGTSMSAPLVAGCAALVREYYAKDRQHEPSAALVKATLINGTRRLTGEDAIADHDRLPNFHQGFGALYMPWAIPNPAVPDLQLAFLDPWQDPSFQFVRNGQRFRFRLSCGNARPLRFCLVWTDLPMRALQNNIDVFIQLPSGEKVLGNTDLPMKLTRLDRDNNVEVIRIEDPPIGDYMVQITASNLLRGPQDFALVVTGDLTSSLEQV